MVFVLLERDKAAPAAVRTWINERIRLKKNTRKDAQIRQAENWIERSSWKWPAWLKSRYIAQNENGLWYGYKSRPVLDKEDGSWFVSRDRCGDNLLRSDHLDFTPPPCTGWKESLRENPAFCKEEVAGTGSTPPTGAFTPTATFECCSESGRFFWLGNNGNRVDLLELSACSYPDGTKITITEPGEDQ